MTSNDKLQKADTCEYTFNNTTKLRANEDLENYVKLLRDTFDQNLFPSDFDEWTVSQKYKWINKNLSKFYPNVPESLLKFIPASFRQGDCGQSPVKKPEWLDMDKYRRGQKFAQEYLVGITISVMLSLLPAFSFENILNPVILGNQSHTLYLSFKRYVSAIHRMFSWFNGEPWVKETPAFQSMQITRRKHMIIREKLSRIDEVKNACKFANPWSPDRELLLKDFAEACPFEKIGQRPYKSFIDLPFKQKYVNSADMAMIQLCFVGFILLYPQEFGVHGCTDEDFEAYCHLWRCYGYYLGIEDEYNFCSGSLKEIKRCFQDYCQYWMIPNLKEVTSEWEHITRCIVEPLNYYPFLRMSYKSAMLLIINPLDVNMPRLSASLSYSDWIIYKIWKFILRYALKLSSIRLLFNKLLLSSLNQVVKYSPEKEAKLQMRSKKQTPDFSIIF